MSSRKPARRPDANSGARPFEASSSQRLASRMSSQSAPPLTSQPYDPRRRNAAGGIGSHIRTGFNPAIIIGIVVAVLVVVFIAMGVRSCGSHNSGEDSAAAVGANQTESSRTLVLNDAMRGEAPVQGVPERFLDCEETVDENGIVHGTTPDGIRYTVHGRGELGSSSDRVTLCAVGDQLITEYLLPFADAYAGDTGDGVYDFTPWYREVKPFIQKFDLRYINQETVMAGGEDGYEYSGYPVFNSPDSAAESISETGFNLVNFATNHTYDLGTFGIEASHEVWQEYPHLLIGGSYLTKEDRETVHMIERNGMTFAFLAYTYGDNSFSDASNMPNDYYSCVFDKAAIEADVKRAQQIADAVIVSMHWGTEYTNEPNDQQIEYARFLADLDVDLVLGSHAHTIQPVEYVTGESGNEIPVVYGLSDFTSCWTITNTIISGIFSCDFVRGENGDVEVKNLAWHPTIEWDDGSGKPYVRMLADMDQAETNANTRTPDVEDDYTYLRDLTNSVIEGIPVIWE